MLIKIKNIIFKLIYTFIISYLLIFVPTLIGYKPLVVISGSMEPTLRVGGLLYYYKININDFKNDDVLVYDTNENIISHRIKEITEEGFITQGDANNTIDSNLINKNQVMGKGTNWSIPYIGYYADYIYSHKYILEILIMIIIIDLIYEQYQIKKKEKEINNEKDN